MKTTIQQVSVLGLILMLSACGGGGGSTTPTPTPTPCSLTGVNIFPADNPWRTEITQAPLDPRSNAIISFLNETAAPPFADFGSGLYENVPIGIPYVVVCANQPLVPIIYRADATDGNYGSESDPGPFPIPLNAPIESYGIGDSHVITVDAANHKLYELYNASLSTSGTAWEASSGAKFDLDGNALRPLCYTSADAAGLPIFPGLVRYDEVATGAINHPIRFTLQRSRVSPMFVAPARHYVNGTNTNAAYPTPMGMRLRLKASVSIGAFSQTNRVILTAMQRYGIILADIGSNFYISGSPDPRWDNDDLKNLHTIRPSDFEVVQMGTIFNSASPADLATCAP